ncbi:TAXI family TRAP transporter solute-binding subunit [Halobacillus shinanisalinarum]|uniref:TAXI family TRAP transporter solute-binding subunit n=1 Tax=Halobacillus shinanisalinarum TaxID=2932258 RepID=A0ABY4H4A2_9BACI|nr:TAXI family TRAP transporter solute-binding subunit [Halobacillus shinanisalinarum]UOQ95131.1 TAXI family TRAP transporter solute-binding subunit [Halobacillus shinanisalinarum]
MRKNIFLIILLISSALTFVGCSNSSKSNASNGDNNEGSINLPSLMTWSVYDVGASGYAEMSAIADMLTEQYNTNIRLIPSATGVGRMTVLRDGQASIGKLGDESQFAFEGREEYADLAWGPQNLRAVWSPISQYGFGVREEDGIESIEDLKGKKIPYFPGNSSVNVKTEAMLAFGDLTWDDVEVVELTTYAGQGAALAQGQIDAVSGIPSSSTFYETDSKSKIDWINMNPNDDEGWSRVEEVAPWLFPESRDDGAGMEGETPLMGYGYSIVSYADAENIKSLLEAMDENFDQFKDAVPGASLYAKEKVLTEPRGLPFHEETVEFFKENGMWSEEKQAKNDELIERSNRLAEAWEKVVAEAKDKGISDEKFAEYWLERKSELVK